jgi:Tfp pilus assembly protein PilF
MESKPRRLGLVGRRGLLFSLLALAILVLIVKWSDLALAYRLNSARSALRGGDWTGAAAILERSQQRGETSPQWHYLWACSQRRAGEVDQAELHLAKAAALGWDLADIDRQRLLIRAQSGQIKQVEGQLAELLQAGVSDEAGEEIYEAMARGYLSTFEVADATQCLDFWARWQSDNVLPHLWMGDLLRRLENPMRAAEEYRQVLQINPNHTEAQLNLAQILLEQLKLEEAEPLLLRVLTSNPESPDALLGLAEIRHRQGSVDSARSLLYDALTLDLNPIHTASALAILGQMALEDRQYHRAVQLLEKSVSSNASAPAPHLALGAALASLGEESLAAAHRTTASRLQEQARHMMTVMRKSVAEPNNADLRCEMGQILMRQGLWSAGAQWLKTALVIDPSHKAANEGLASYYEQLGERVAAQRHRQAAQQSTSSQPALTPQSPASSITK